MKELQYTAEENEIVEYIEEQNPSSIPDIEKRKAQLKQIVSDNVTRKNRSISGFWKATSKN